MPHIAVDVLVLSVGRNQLKSHELLAGSLTGFLFLSWREISIAGVFLCSTHSKC